MVFEHIEKLKREYTDKYVVVDASRPELRRFEGQTGIVRTVNMNGNALVEFDAHLNIGWYDIALDYLKVVDAPLPKPEKKAPAKKPAKAAAKPAAKAPAAKPAGGGGGMSVAEMLAAARGEKSGGGAPAAKPAAPAAEAKPVAPAKPASADASKMSVADMLAAARAEKSGGGAAPATPDPPAPAPEPEPAASEPEAAAPPSGGDLPTDIPGIVAYCRKADGG